MKPFYTHREELWNSWSHAAGILLGMAFGMVFLYWCFRVKDGWATFGVSLYLLGMVGSYVASTSYHALRPTSPWKERLRKWDHAAIYWHIAGSYSPITLVALRGEGPWGWLLFAFVWTCAIGGTISSLRKLKPHSNIETLTYVGMGLSVLVAFKPLLHAVEVSSVAWIIVEGDVCHGCGLLFPPPPPLFPHRFPFLRPCGKSLPYRGRLGHPAAVSLSRPGLEYLLVVYHPSKGSYGFYVRSIL